MPTTQTVWSVGSNTVIVQIEGDNNKVVVHDAHLRLSTPAVRVSRGGIRGEADLLKPYNRAIPFVGRDAHFDDLRRWLHSDQPISVRVYGTGALAIEEWLSQSGPARGEFREGCRASGVGETRTGACLAPIGARLHIAFGYIRYTSARTCPPSPGRG